jgi:myo-inositol-1(or 4)-monophosphatase
LIISYLHKQLLDIGFVAEEQNAQANQQAKDNSYYFVVDPLDGTQCFVDGIPFFCISFALHHNNGPVTIAGVIMNPDKNEKFTASLENCGFLSGDMIHVSKRNRIEEIK